MQNSNLIYLLCPNKTATRTYGQIYEPTYTNTYTIHNIHKHGISLFLLIFFQGFIALFGILVTNPIGQSLGLPLQPRQHLLVHFRQIQHVPNAVLPVIGIDGSLAEKGEIALRPHLVVLVLVLVDAVGGLVPLEDLVETGSAHVGALRNYLLCCTQQSFTFLSYLLSLLFAHFHFLPQPLVRLQLPNQSLSGTRIKDIDDACFKHLVQANGIVSAVVEYFDDVLIDHHISQYFSRKPKGLKITQLIHMPNVNEEGVAAVVQLNHLYETAPSKSALKVNAQNGAAEDMRCAFGKGLEGVNVVRLSLSQWLSILEGYGQKLLGRVRLLEVALAGGGLKLQVDFGVVDELMHGEGQEGIPLQCEVGTSLVDQVSVIIFDGLYDVLEHFAPLDQSFGDFLCNELSSHLQHSVN